MQRVLIYSMLSVIVTAGAACSKTRDETSRRPSLTDVAGATADRGRVEVIGCLTADPQTNRFVLTAHSSSLTALTNRAAAGEAETFHYQLVGGSDLQAMVGKEVKVTGEVLGKGNDVDVKRTEKSLETPKGGDPDATPAVKTTEEIEMQVEQLRVAAVSATGNSCQAAR